MIGNAMPAAKKAARDLTKKTVRGAAKKSSQKAVAEDRTMSATVNRYLAAVTAPKRRGRKVSKATLEQRLERAQETVRTATGVEKLLAARDARSLTARLSQMTAADSVDVQRLEAEFVKVAKRFSENRGITYGAWRDAGVPAQVLKRAGVARTRG
jgi:uncharacterized protein YicC (UPF0701 family)